MRVARGLDRQHLARPRQRERKGPETRKQIRNRRRPVEEGACIADQHALPILGGLQETALREGHRERAERDRQRLRFPHGLGAETAIEREPGERIGAREIEQRLGRREAIRLDPLERAVHAFVDQREFDIDRLACPMFGNQRTQRPHQCE